MKAVALLLLCVSGAASLRSLHLGFQMTEKSAQRLKRQAGTGLDMSMVDSILCSIRCWTLAGPEISRQIQRALSGRSGFSAQEEQDSFKRSCQAYADIKDCEQRGCGKNLADNSVASNGYEAIDYMCDARNVDQWSANLPCIRRVEAAVGGNCSATCAQNQASTFSGIGDLDQLIGAMTQGFCDFTKCTVECEARAVSQQCGQAAANLINGFVARSINSVQKVMDATTTDQAALQDNFASARGMQLPASCQQMIRSSGRPFFGVSRRSNFFG